MSHSLVDVLTDHRDVARLYRAVALDREHVDRCEILSRGLAKDCPVALRDNGHVRNVLAHLRQRVAGERALTGGLDANARA